MSRKNTAARRGHRAHTHTFHARAQLPVPDPRRVRTACLLAAACFFVYVTNLRAPALWDTIPARLLPFSVLREGNLDLDEFTWLQSLEPPPYFLRHTSGGHWVSKYPVLTPLLVTPLALPAVWWTQHQQIDDDDVRFRLAAIITERIAAACIAAASVAVVFLALTWLASRRTSLIMALVYAFGTNTFVTSSQALWQHGLSELSLAGLSFFLLAPNTRRYAVAASACAALGVMARPTMVVFAVVALRYMWRERRTQLWTFLALPLSGAVLLLAYNLILVGGILGGYGGSDDVLVLPKFANLAGLLVSPNRGLLIYTPAAALALLGVLQPARRGWLRYLGIGIGGYLLLYASFKGWSGGSTYGPRMLVDALPAMVLCAVPVVERWMAFRMGRWALLLLVGWGVGVQGIGVYCDDNSWNSPQPGVAPPWARVWDFQGWQIGRAAHAGWHGTDLAPLLWQMMSDPRPALLHPLPGEALRGEIEIEGPRPLRYRSGDKAEIRVRVTNRGTTTWPVLSDYGFLECKLIYLWWAGSTLMKDAAGGIVLPRNVGSGESVQLQAAIDVPRASGTYELELQVVQVLDVNQGMPGQVNQRVPVQIE